MSEDENDEFHREYIVVMTLKLSKNEIPPWKWDWDRLLDLSNHEEVEILVAEEKHGDSG